MSKYPGLGSGNNYPNNSEVVEFGKILQNYRKFSHKRTNKRTNK